MHDLHHMRSILLTLSLSLLIGCGTGSGSGDEEPTDLAQRCTNSSKGFSVSYQAGWTTNRGEVVPACTAFDPDAFEIPRDSEMPFDIAVVIDVEDVPYERITEPSRAERIISNEQVTIDGRDARRVEVESTGEGLASPGMRSLRYVVDLGNGRSLVATTHDVEGTDYHRNQEILGRMMASLDLLSN